MTGVWAAADHEVPCEQLQRLCEVLPALQRRLPATAASHVSAALLLGLRLPATLRGPGPIHLTRWQPGRAPRLAGVRGHVSALDPEDRWLTRKIRLTGPVRTIVDLAGVASFGTRKLPLIHDDGLVALLDGVISEHRTGIHAGRPPLRSMDLVQEDMARMSGRRGAARVRRNLQRARVGVDSALETHARLALDLAGLTGFVTDHQIHAPGIGTAYPDLADLYWRISIQVDGPHHDGPGQRKRDINRLRVTEAEDWIEVRVTEADIFALQIGAEPNLVSLVRAARNKRLRQPARPHRR